jgi:hypothetical protein
VIQLGSGRLSLPKAGTDPSFMRARFYGQAILSARDQLVNSPESKKCDLVTADGFDVRP